MHMEQRTGVVVARANEWGSWLIRDDRDRKSWDVVDDKLRCGDRVAFNGNRETRVASHCRVIGKVATW
jgi:hypothetical protein